MVDRVTEQAVMTWLFNLQTVQGYLSNRQVGEASVTLGITPVNVRRRVRLGLGSGARPKYTLGQEEVNVLYACAGNATETYRTLGRMGFWDNHPGPTLRTFQRAVGERLDAQVRAGALGGRTAHDACNPTIARVVTHKNESWATDHKKLPVLVNDGNGNAVEVWSSEILDEATRFVVGSLLTPGSADTEDDRELLAVAVEGVTHVTEFGDVFVGGVPHTLHSDRGGDYVSWAATVGLVETGIERSFTMPYSPNANGRVESFHGYLEKNVCPQLPGYQAQRYQHRNPAALKPACDVGSLLTLEELSVIVAKRLHEYNFVHVHGTLGMTPFQAWCADPTEVRLGDPAAIRAAMRPQETRKVDHGRIRFRNTSYTCAALATVEGRRVQFRYLNSDTRFVEVDLGGGTYARAWDIQQMPDDVQHELVAARAPRAVAFNSRMRAADVIRARTSRQALDEAFAEFTPEEVVAAQVAMLGPAAQEPAPIPAARQRHRERIEKAADAAIATGAIENDDFELPTPTILKGHAHAS